MSCRNNLIPNALPNATLSGVPYVAAQKSLLTSQLRAGIAWIPNAKHELSCVRHLSRGCRGRIRNLSRRRAFPCLGRPKQIRNVKRKRQVTASMCANKLTVYKTCAHPVDRIKMQNKSLVIGQFWQVNFAPIPQKLIWTHRSTNSRKRSFWRERHHNLPIPTGRNLLLREGFCVHLAIYRRNRILPHAVQHHVIVALHTRTRMLRQHVRCIKRLSPNSRQRIKRLLRMLFGRTCQNTTNIQHRISRFS